MAEVRGFDRPGEIVVVSAHYDSVRGAVGANDDASGVAILIELARRLAGLGFERTVRFAAFANEEPPHTRRRSMGGLRYARACAARGERPVAMMSLECLGWWSPRARDRLWPLSLLDRGDALYVVANRRSRALADTIARALRAGSERFTTRRIVAPGLLPLVRSSDHWSFWKIGAPAVMLTDGGPLRSRHYHRPTDTPERLDYDRMAELVPAIGRALEAVAGFHGPRFHT